MTNVEAIKSMFRENEAISNEVYYKLLEQAMELDELKRNEILEKKENV